MATTPVLRNEKGIIEVAQPVPGKPWEVRWNKDSGGANYGPFPATQTSCVFRDLTINEGYHIYTRTVGSPTWSERWREVALKEAVVTPAAKVVEPVAAKAAPTVVEKPVAPTTTVPSAILTYVLDGKSVTVTVPGFKYVLTGPSEVEVRPA